MNININEIRGLIKEKQIIWSKHILTRMQQRGIKIKDVLNCIKNGIIIEEYPEDFPYPSCLIFGFSVDNKVIHIVCAIGENKLWMITTYFPSRDDWKEDLKTRRN